MKIYDKAYFYFRHHIAISFLLEETIHQVFEIKKNLRTCHSYLIYNFFMLYVVYSSNILYMTFSFPVLIFVVRDYQMTGFILYFLHQFIVLFLPLYCVT